MKGHWITWSAAELKWIEARKERPRRELHAEFCTVFGRKDVGLDAFKALCKRKKWLTGRTGQFVLGQEGWNTGKSMPFNEKSAQHRFKKGQASPNVKGFGHERITDDGYVEVSVPEVNPHTGYGRRYVQKHRWLWEQANGPVPKGMRLKCLDRNKLNTDPSNWKALPYALAPRLNGKLGRGYDAAPAEVKSTILAVTELEYLAKQARKKMTEADNA